ncbi:MAG: polysaccharide deacetylase family protein [Solirubrobacteraceae bacterium]
MFVTNHPHQKDPPSLGANRPAEHNERRAMRRISRWTIAVLTVFAAVASVAAVGIASAARTPKAPKTVACKDVIAKGGSYEATSIRVTAMGCAEARKYLFSWVQRGSKSLPHYRNFWRSRRVAGGRWLVEYGHKPIRPTITFLIKAMPKPASPKPPSTTPTPTPTPAPDTTLPVIHLTSPLDGEKLEAGTVVTAHFTCTDDVVIARCDGTFPDGGTIPTNVLGTHRFVVNAMDAAGNVATLAVNYTVVDTTPPQITITAPATAASYTWGQAATAQYSCSDTVAVASCTAAVGGTGVTSGAALPTSGAPGPGTRTLTVTAKDTSGNTSTKTVDYAVQPAGYYAMTFDDGPNETYTQSLLTALATLKAHATFFLVGQNVDWWPALAQAEAAAGMTLGNHTYTHANLGPLDPTDPTVPPTSTDPNGELSRTQTAIQNATGVTPTFFRPPYGQYDATTFTWLTPFGLNLTAWTVDSGDSGTPTPTAAQIAATAETVQPGGIILMHDAHQQTIAAVPTIVNDLASKRGLLPGKLMYDPTTAVPGPYGAPQPDFFVHAVAP